MKADKNKTRKAYRYTAIDESVFNRFMGANSRDNFSSTNVKSPTAQSVKLSDAERAKLEQALNVQQDLLAAQAKTKLVAVKWDKIKGAMPFTMD